MPWDNPIWTYHVRARWWRGLSRAARWAILVAAILLGAATSLAVAAGSALAGLSGLASPLRGGALGGLYVLYSVIAAVWAGLCASAAIAPDRQRGLWEGLVVSRLSPREIILAKFAAALWPVSLLALWALPIWLAPFLLDPDQVDTSLPLAVAAAWVAVRALTRPLPFAAIGLYVSFRSRNQTEATARTMALLGPLLITSLVTMTGYVPTRNWALIALWFLIRGLLLPPAAATDSIVPPIAAVLSLAADLVWIALVPLGVLGFLIRRFSAVDRWMRGDRGGRRAPRPEARPSSEAPESAHP